MNVRRAMSVCAAVAAAALLMSSCGSSSGSGSGSGSTSGPGSGSPGSAGGSGPQLGVSQSDLGGAKDYTALAALYKKAVAEGQTDVVIYGPSAGSDSDLYAAFKKAFPKITVKGVPVVGPPMDAKLSAENTSGKHIGDIAYTGNTNMLQYLAKGYFAQFTPITAPGASHLVGAAIGPHKGFYGVTETLAGAVTNTSTVKSPPRKWTDYENSKYKNKLAMYDPTAIGMAADVFAHLDRNPKYKNLMSGLKANNVQLFPASSLTGPLTAVAQGAKDVAVMMGYNFFQEAKDKGAPVKFSLMDADNYTVILYQAVLKGAPHPLAAQLYMDWMYTPQAQKVIAESGAYSTVKGAPAPKGLKPLTSIPLMKALPFAQVVPANNAAIQQAKKYWGG